MNIKINGEQTQVDDTATVGDVIWGRTAGDSPVVVVLNGDVLKRENWNTRKLGPDDSVEIVRIVGGG